MFDRIGETMFHETMYHLFNNALHKVMRMEVVLRKYGNSTVLAFPPAVLKDLPALLFHSAGRAERRAALDLVARKAKRVEQVPQVVIDDAIGRLISLFE